MARKLIVEILGDSTSLERSFNRSTASAKKFEGQTLSSVGRVDGAFKKIQGVTAGAFVGGAAATALIEGVRKVTAAASDLNEQITKNQQVFGTSAAAVQAWSETTAKSIGISETAALTATGTFGNLFTAIGVTGPAAANMSTNLVKLAADLASFNNASPEDVLDAIRSGLIGEAEPMRRYGVLLSEARVQQLALTETGKTNVKELTNQEKALARYHIILGDTTKAQGDFERTSGGLANQQRILAAEVSDLQTKLGRLLLPGITKITGALVAATGSATDLADGLRAIGKIKIPPIHIPFVIDTKGGDTGFLGDFAKKIALGGAEALPGLGPFVKAVEIQMEKARLEAAEAAKLAAAKESTQLANDFADSFNTMFQSALDQSVPKLKSPTFPANFTDLLFNVGIPGFATGATPADILGPLVTELPIKVQQQIADAELSGKGIRAAHVKALKILTDAINDPRLKAKDRLALTQAAIAEQNAIDSIDQDAANAADSAAKDAASKRDARRTKAAQDRADAARKARERRQRIREREAKEAAREAKRLQTRQFRAIGLGPEGSEIIPRVENLRKQFQQLGANIEPGQLSSKLRKQFAGVGKLLRGDLGKVTEATREAINNLFKTIRSTFEQGGDQLKISPATTALNKNKIVDGLGLDRDTERIIKSRLSGFNAAGRRLSPRTGTTGAFGITITPQPIHVNTTVNLDGEKVARNTTIHQGKRARSNPAQKRGPLRGI